MGQQMGVPLTGQMFIGADRVAGIEGTVRMPGWTFDPKLPALDTKETP
jgi:hypothetical protein